MPQRINPKKINRIIENQPRLPVREGLYYLYSILSLQMVFALALVAGTLALGQFLSAPFWFFLLAIGLGTGAGVYFFRKVKSQLKQVKKTIEKIELSDRNYEISILGGAISMRVEKPAQKQLPSPADPEVAESIPEQLPREAGQE